ncbi:MAG: hypothetical protein HUK12_00935 [Muribaculaceae bacterium]|nr:hypothetical protein [Muribaculaceae bacterium]
MTQRERLAKRLKDELGFEIDPTTWHTTRAGMWQRSSGACSSYARLKDSPVTLLFYGPIHEYLRKDVYLDTWSESYETHVNWEKRNKEREALLPD